MPTGAAPMINDLSFAVGNTPLVKLNSISKDLPADIAVKLEYTNPTASVKDRAASNIIAEAEKLGLIKPGKTVLIEGTSGNTGISLAAIARVRGYKCVCVMPSGASIERRVVLKAYGAELVLTDPALGFTEVDNRVNALAELIPGAFKTNQFGNPANWQAHYKGTGPEIWEQTDGKVGAVCFGIGTGGTVTGVGKFLREKNPNVKVYGVEPYESSILNGFPKGPHMIQGIGAGVVPPILEQSILDEVLRVKSEDAIAMAQRLALEEGIMGGISSGGNVCAAVELAKRPELKGKLIVTTINSFGERYLSSPLYEPIQKDCSGLTHSTLEESLEEIKRFIAA